MSRTLEGGLDSSKWRRGSRASQGRGRQAAEHRQRPDVRIESVNPSPEYLLIGKDWKWNNQIITGVNFRLQDRWVGTMRMGRWFSFQCVHRDSPQRLTVNSAE